MVGMFAWFFGRGPKPQFDRYTYWEKFDYVSLAIGTVIIGAHRVHDVVPAQDHGVCCRASS